MTISKIVKNISNTDRFVNDCGISIYANTNYTIPEQDYWIWAASLDIISELDQNHLIINDGYQDLSITASKALLRHNLFQVKEDGYSTSDEVYKVNFTTGLDVTNEGYGLVTVRVDPTELDLGSSFEFTGNSTGTTGNKWLGNTDNAHLTHYVPFICPYDATLIAATFSNSNDSSSIDIEIYKNGLVAGNKIFTWQLRTKRWAYRTQNLGITVSRGDRIAIYAKTVIGTSPKDIVVKLLFKSTNNAPADTGSATL
jgi:hypothetical protein